MRKFNAENERLKARYEQYLKEAKGQDEKSLDKVRAALVRFEDSTKFKPFKAFHIEQARCFKDALSKAKTAKGKPLSLSTTDATLRLVKGFFHWLAGQQGFKKIVSYSDVEYFNNNMKDARAAHAQRPQPYPSLQQCAHAFRLMPEETGLHNRDKALFALWVMTGARAGALASLRLKHVNVIDGLVFQDGREVKTKNAKTLETWFFPVDPMYLTFFTAWVQHLTNDHLFGPGDALFPKQRLTNVNGRFVANGFEREPYANSQIINMVVGAAFTNSGQPVFAPHSIRRTLAMWGDRICTTMEQRKAWSQNLGHESLSTTISAYMPVNRERQGELLKSLTDTN